MNYQMVSAREKDKKYVSGVLLGGNRIEYIFIDLQMSPDTAPGRLSFQTNTVIRIELNWSVFPTILLRFQTVHFQQTVHL